MKKLLAFATLLIVNLGIAQVSTSSLSVTPGPGTSDGLYTSALRITVKIMQYHRPCTGKVTAVTNYKYTAYAYQYKGVKYLFKNGNLVNSQNEVVINGLSDHAEAANFNLEIFLNVGISYEVSGHAGGNLQQVIIQEDLAEYKPNGEKTDCVDLHSFSIASAKVIQSPRFRDTALELRIDDFLRKQQSPNQDDAYTVNTNAGSDWNDSSSSASSTSRNSSPQQPDYTKAYDGQKYVPQYVTNGQSQAQINNARAEQVQLQQSYEARQKQQQAFEQSLAAQNQQALDMYAQAFEGDQLATGLAQSAQAIGSAIGGFNDYNAMGTAAANVIGGLIADGQRRKEEREREEALWREQERIREEKEAYIATLVSARETALNKLPEPKYPNTTTSSSLKTAYFYSLFYQADSLKNGSAKMKVTDIFAVNQYSDATWPFITKTQDKLSKYTGEKPKLIGYFESYDAAYNSMAALTSTLAENAVAISFLNIAEDFDTPVNYTTTDSNSPKKDFWGNTINNTEVKNTKSKPSQDKQPKETSDFWGETIPNKTTQIKATKKPEEKDNTKKADNTDEDDFWGNPIKIDTDKDN